MCIVYELLNELQTASYAVLSRPSCSKYAHNIYVLEYSHKHERTSIRFHGYEQSITHT